MKDTVRYLILKFYESSSTAHSEEDRGHPLEAMIAHAEAAALAGALAAATGDVQWTAAQAKHRARLTEHLEQVDAWKAFKALSL